MRKLLLFFILLPFLLLQTDYNVNIAQVDVSQLPEVTLYVNVTDSGGQPVTTLTKDDFQVTEDGQPVTLNNFSGIGDDRPVDVVFVFDTTGSMEEEINGAIASCEDFADALDNAGRDYRLGLVTFGDAVREVFNPDDSLTDNVREFKSWLGTLSAYGGDDDPENQLAAIQRAARMEFRDEAQIIMILITDDAVHHYGDMPPQSEGGFNDPNLTYEHTLETLSNPRPITLYAIIDPDRDLDGDLENLADETNGRTYDLLENPDFTDIIDDIGAVIATQYRMSYTTPRPDFDGTRRNIEISVGGSTVKAGYLEPHLVNMQSNIWVALGCIVPLGLALVIPLVGMLIFKKQPQTVASSMQVPPPPPPPYQPPVSPAAPIPYQGGAPPPTVDFRDLPNTATGLIPCPACGQPVKATARFCGSCGQALAITPASKPTTCPTCGNLLKVDAKFCNKCGTKL